MLKTLDKYAGDGYNDTIKHILYRKVFNFKVKKKNHFPMKKENGMAKKSNLKKTLLASALSLTLSASMLVGTTFAWFTDSVTNAGNKIQAGTLDIDLYDVTTGMEVEVTDTSAPLFNYAKWEPGYRASKVLKVENDGTLALKYRMDVIKTASAGNADICDVIEVWATAPKASYNASDYEWSVDYTYCGTLTEMMAESDGAIHGTL